MTEVKKHAYWIHFKREDKESINGFVYLPQCTCSNCEQRVNYEKPICPYCGAIMDAEAPKDTGAPKLDEVSRN